ncbi:apolipoprotein N-acyltransferase [delta proteobacterium NaphS2]|nr:apolipoprotein N-acyltransferase [delta proteobacterium NaphS2]
MTPATKQRAFSTRDLLLAILSGLLLTASFPPGKFSFLAWIALIPLFISLRDKRPRSAFKLGFIGGFFHYLTLLYWVIVVLGRYGNLHMAISLLALLLLSLFLALYPGLFSALASQMVGTRFSFFFMAALWVSLEFLRAHLFTGFPWCLLGYTQYERLAVIQIADLTGVYGISFLIVLVNGLIFQSFFMKNRSLHTFLKWEWLFVALLVTGTIFYGFQKLAQKKAGKQSDPHLNAAVIQADIDQSVKWKPSYQRKTLETYFRLSSLAAPLKPALIVWPETALPFFYQDAPAFSSQMRHFADRIGATLVFGSPAYERKNRRIEYYNRAYMITPGISSAGYYDKRHLVPFGEYVPLKKYLPFLNQLVQAAGNFVSGGRQGPLMKKDLSLGVLICFEAIFPELARDLARDGAQVLVNITNDAWFGATSAPYQHLSMAVFRSVETGLPMIRAANTGFSAFIGPSGKILSRSALFEEAVLDQSVPFSPSPPATLYTRMGDLFAGALLLISLLKLFYLFRMRVKRKGS